MSRFRRATLPSTLLLLPMAALPASAAQTYTVDTVHSSIHFHASRFDVVDVWGRFNDFSGTIVVDEENPSASSIRIEVQMESVDTGVQRRDDHLRSPDFFNAKQFPVMTFESTEIEALDDDTYRVSGELSLHGVTRSITAEVEKTGEGKAPRGGEPLIGFRTRFTIQRSDYGMNFMVGPLGDEVKVLVVVQGVGQ